MCRQALRKQRPTLQLAHLLSQQHQVAQQVRALLYVCATEKALYNRLLPAYVPFDTDAFIPKVCCHVCTVLTPI